MPNRIMVPAIALLVFAQVHILPAQERREAPQTSDTARPATSADVERAIAKAVAFLYSQQREGNWEESQTKQSGETRGPQAVTSTQWGGLSSIATFSLLAAGENEQDPRLAKTLAFLKTADVTGTYALGLKAQVWNLLPTAALKEYRPSIRKDGGILLKGLRLTGDAKGLYHYTPNDLGWDNSTAQFGVLGMWACAQLAYEVPNRYWKEVEEAWIRHQDRSGGWTYGGGGPGPPPGQPRPGAPGPGPGGARPPGAPPGRGPAGAGGPPDSDRVTLSMTAAGVATLFITQDYLHDDAGVECKGNVVNPAIDRGLQWIDKHFSEVDNDRHYFYTLFGISRIGLASGYKFLGSKDWFKYGAGQLVYYQRADGSWGDGVADTAFALLFLVRGRAPVVMNKLEYSISQPGGSSTSANWNQRPRDAANATNWVGKAIERNLNWQVVNLSVNASELNDAPILYLTGNQAMSFNVDEQEKLRAFVEQGGMILGNADCGSKAFCESFKKLGHALFGAYEFRELPANHLIYTGELVRPGTKAPVRMLGLSNGCRELMLLIPDADPARYWQTKFFGRRQELFDLLANIYLYAVDKSNERFKGDTYVVVPDANITAKTTIKLARLQCNDNWDPEPGGWRRLSAILHNRDATDLTVEAIPLGEGKLAGYKLAHLTGTTVFQLSDGARAELKKFVADGGTLIIDAAGGSPVFAGSTRNELQTIFGDSAKSLENPISSDHRLFQSPGEKAEAVNYRRFARKLVGQLKVPRLRGIEINGRLAVIFSEEDLTEGLVGQPVDGIYGYEPDSATRLMRCILQYATGPTTTAAR